MDYFSKLKAVFHVSDINFNERMKIVEANFEIEDADLPLFDSIKDFIMAIPPRDKVVLTLTDDSDEHCLFALMNMPTEEMYASFCQSARLGDVIAISVNIEKEVY